MENINQDEPSFLVRMYLLHFSLLLIFSIALIYTELLSSYIIILTSVVSIIILKTKKETSVLKSKLSILSFSMFIVLIVGFINTSNTGRGFIVLEHKLSFLAMPVALAPLVFYMTKKRMNLVIYSFSVSTIIGALICLITATWVYYVKEQNIFVYSYFTQIINIHPAYFSAMSIFSFLNIGKLLYDKHEKLSYIKLVILTLAASFQFVFIILLKARTPLIILALIILIITLFLLYKRQLKPKGVFFLSILIIVGGLMISKDPFIKYRLTVSINSSIENRLNLWEASFNAIEFAPFLGVGTGDVQSTLNQYYKDNNLEEPLRENYNSHNEYLQTFVRNGILGLIVLLVYWCYILMFSLYRKNFYLFTVTFIFMIFGMTESLFNTQKGIMFFTFFSTFIYFYQISNLKTNTRGIEESARQ